MTRIGRGDGLGRSLCRFALVAVMSAALGAGLAAPAQAEAPLPAQAVVQQGMMTQSMMRPGAVRVVTYRNCTELQKVHPHGVGKKGAVDKSGGKVKANRVKNFLVHDKLYAKNIKLDRDKDGVACEKK